MRSVPAAVLAAVAAVAGPAAAVLGQAVPDRVTFCLADQSLPMSTNLGPTPGYDVEIADALAAAMGVERRYTWLEPGHDDFEDAVRERRCDAALGVITDAGPMAEAPDLRGLALTGPYYETGYVLLRRRDAAPLARLGDAGDTRIAVEGESVVTFTLRQSGRRVHVLDDYEGVIRAVAEGRAKYGYLWGPVAAWTLRTRDDVLIAPEFRSDDRWPFAVAVRAEDAELRARLEAAIARLRSDGTIAEILDAYAMETAAGSLATSGSR
jgi:polar amino acid transport system substrate-binding protein